MGRSCCYSRRFDVMASSSATILTEGEAAATILVLRNYPTLARVARPLTDEQRASTVAVARRGCCSACLVNHALQVDQPRILRLSSRVAFVCAFHCYVGSIGCDVSDHREEPLRLRSSEPE